MAKINYERQKRRDHVAALDLTFTTLGALLEEVQDMIKAYGVDARVDDYKYDYDDNTYHGGIWIDVDESDREMTARIAKEEAWAATCEERDVAEYARLQKKFGKE